MTRAVGCTPAAGMANVLSAEKRQQVIALGRLGWSLRRIEEATGVRRETASTYLKAAGIAIRPPGGWGRRPVPKPANETSTDSGPTSTAKPANGVSTDSPPAWPPRPGRGAPLQRRALRGEEDPHTRGVRSPSHRRRQTNYRASIQLPDPASLTATFEKDTRRAVPSAVPWWSVEKRSGPAVL